MIDPSAGSLFVQQQCTYLEEGYNEQRQRNAEIKAAVILEQMLYQSIRDAGSNRGPTKF